MAENLNPRYVPVPPPESRPPDGRHVHEGGGANGGNTPAWTVNEIVSFNLLRARRARGWTQQEFGDALGVYTGRAWSNASVSAAERAWQGGRPRKFDVDEIHAFCTIFDVPLAYFLLPPEGDFLVISPMGPDEEKAGKFRTTGPVDYLRRILGVDPSADFVDRAQAAVSDHASLDFVPARWEWSGKYTTPDAARPNPARVEKAPADETRPIVGDVVVAADVLNELSKLRQDAQRLAEEAQRLAKRVHNETPPAGDS